MSSAYLLESRLEYFVTIELHSMSNDRKIKALCEEGVKSFTRRLGDLSGIQSTKLIIG